MERGLIDPAAGEWKEVLGAADHDFYHLPCYSTLSALPDERARGFLAQEAGHRLLIPFIQRPVPAELTNEPLFDLTSPYGYPGPIATRGAPAAFITKALAAFSEALKEENIICSFVRLHTLLNDPDHFSGIGELVNHGPSVFIDLTHSADELWQQTRRGHRRDLVDLQKRGYEIIMDDWTRLDDFIKCYYESMERVKASAFYFFSKSYFEGLRRCIGEDRIHLCLVYRDGDIACAGLVTEMGGLCQYHLSATADDHLQDHPSKLMLHYLRGWLKERGNRIYHIGGGVGSLRDTLHLFKTGFSPYAADFYTWRLISNAEAYDRLLDRWCELSGSEPVKEDEFFPQYRAAHED